VRQLISRSADRGSAVEISYKKVSAFSVNDACEAKTPFAHDSDRVSGCRGTESPARDGRRRESTCRYLTICIPGVAYHVVLLLWPLVPREVKADVPLRITCSPPTLNSPNKLFYLFPIRTSGFPANPYFQERYGLLWWSRKRRLHRYYRLGGPHVAKITSAFCCCFPIRLPVPDPNPHTAVELCQSCA
jgi:hypothetical protein